MSNTFTLIGDISGIGSKVINTTVSDNAITNNKLGIMSGFSIKGNKTNEDANPQDLSVVETKNLLQITTQDILYNNQINSISTSSLIQSTSLLQTTIDNINTNSNLVSISKLTPNNNDFMQFKNGIWNNRTIYQVQSDLGLIPIPTIYSGDVSGSGLNNVNLTILPNIITNSKLALMEPMTIKGNLINQYANAIDLTIQQLVNEMPIFNITTNGLVPMLQTNNPNLFLQSDGTWKQINSLQIQYNAMSGGIIPNNINNINEAINTININSNLSQISKLLPNSNDILQYKNGQWNNQSIIQIKNDLNISGINTGDQIISLYGAITGSGMTNIQTSITNNSISNYHFVPMPALTIKGNNQNGSSYPSDLTINQLINMLPNFIGLTNHNPQSGLVPTPNSNNVNYYLKSSGSWEQINAEQINFTNLNNNVLSYGINVQNVLNDINTNIKLLTINNLSNTELGTLANFTSLIPTNGDFLQYKNGQWTSRTISQVQSDLNVAIGGSYVNLFGDVIGTGFGNVPTIIQSNVITNNKLNIMPPMTIKGNNTIAGSNPIDLTPLQIINMLPSYNINNKGLVPLSLNNNINEYLQNNNGWQQIQANEINYSYTSGNIIQNLVSDVQSAIDSINANSNLSQIAKLNILQSNFIGKKSSGGITSLNKQDIFTILNSNQSNGICVLDSNGKIPLYELPSSVLLLKGNWNAQTNIPTLSDGTGTLGNVYYVTNAGTHNFGSGNITFSIGNWVIYGSDNKWYRSGNSYYVNSIFGRSGDITANLGDYNASQITFTPQINNTLQNISTTVQNAIDYINSNSQPLNSSLTSFSTLTPTNNDVLQWNQNINKWVNAPISNTAFANMNSKTIKGNNMLSTSQPQDLSSSDVTNMLNIFSNSSQGVVPSSSNNISPFNYLCGDATWRDLRTTISTTTYTNWSPQHFSQISYNKNIYIYNGNLINLSNTYNSNFIITTSSSLVTFIVQTDTNGGTSLGSFFEFFQQGLGTLTLVASSNVIIYGSSSMKQYSYISLTNVGTNTWFISSGGNSSSGNTNSSVLSDLTTALNDIANNQQIYLYKDNNGTIQASNTQNPNILNNMGYQFQYFDGTIIYTIVPISSIQNIPWINNYSTLNTLWNSNLLFWLDASENYSINQSLQKMISKGYNTNEIFVGGNNKFLYSTQTIDLNTNSTYIVSYNTLLQQQYWEVAIVFELFSISQNFSLNNYIIFSHNNINICLTRNTTADTTTQIMFSLFDGNTFICGIAINSNDNPIGGYKYYIYANDSKKLTVSGNVYPLSSSSPITYNNASNLVYIGGKSNGTNISNIKINEILYNTKSSTFNYNDSILYSYLSNKWNLTTYSDLHNIPPFNILNIGSGNVVQYNYTYNNIVYTVIICNSSTTLSFISNLTLNYVYLIGGGGAGLIGGGGAGGVVLLTNYAITSGNYNVIVGTGGICSANNNNSLSLINGNDTTWNNFTAKGGGGGSTHGYGAVLPTTPGTGGCGGGGSQNYGTQIDGAVSIQTTYTGYMTFGYRGGNGYIVSGGGGGAATQGMDDNQYFNGGADGYSISGYGGYGIPIVPQLGVSGIFATGGGSTANLFNSQNTTNTYIISLYGTNNYGGNIGINNNSYLCSGSVRTNSGSGGGFASVNSQGGQNGASGIVIFGYCSTANPIMTITPTGGTTSTYTNTYGGYTYNILICKSNTTLNINNFGMFRFVYIIGGGGASSNSNGTKQICGGGGAGAIVQLNNISVNSGNYFVVVGNGGMGVNYANLNSTTRTAMNGGNSSWNNFVATGGGGGGCCVSGFLNGQDGGCGGGSACLSDGTSGTPGNVSQTTYSNHITYGYTGGKVSNGTSNFWCGGGGGGAGTLLHNSQSIDRINGFSNSNYSGNGGDGFQLDSIVGNTNITYYATGGGSVRIDNSTNVSLGGNNNINNNGGSQNTTNNVTPNSGSGGGVTWDSSSTGQNGASGVVIFVW